MNVQAQRAIADKLRVVRAAALDQSPVRGLTHNFYRYPARFSPQFVRSVIEQFSTRGDVVLDPFMGGGTTIVEGMALGRQMIGTDINSLSVFVTRAKTTLLSNRESAAIKEWATVIVPKLRCTGSESAELPGQPRVPRNMTLPRARWLRILIEQAVGAAQNNVPTPASRRFARCVLLNVGQWSLNGCRHAVTAARFRDKVTEIALQMLEALEQFRDTLETNESNTIRPLLRNTDAQTIGSQSVLQRPGPVDLVVTSPPYPGIHMLYHRWQVDGRKESDAPYWIAACNDGCGTAYYNFADRRRSAEVEYFRQVLLSFSAIRQTMHSRGILVQMVAFSNPTRQLPKYLSALEEAGFNELRVPFSKRIWRTVPSRRWHASSKGHLSSSKEVVLVHSAD